MKYYVVLRGENFEKAINGHKKPFESLDAAKEYTRLFFGTNIEYYICDKDGGIIYMKIKKEDIGYA